jgi:RNA polymerase sigma factor (sigma-70 family)
MAGERSEEGGEQLPGSPDRPDGPSDRHSGVPGQGAAPIGEHIVSGDAGGRVPQQAGRSAGAASGPGSDDFPRQLRPFFRSEEDSGGTVPAQAGPAEEAGDAPAGPPDSELIARVRAGDDSAYEEIYRRHGDSVRRYCRSCCRNAHTAEDLTGEVFFRVLQALRGGRGPDVAVRPYLLTTVRRVAAAWTQTQRREQLVEDFAVFAAGTVGAAAGAESSGALPVVSGSGSAQAAGGADLLAMESADRTMIVQAFRKLPERWQTVLWHTAVEQEPPRRVAPLLGLTSDATKQLAHRAREGLAEAYLQAHVSASLASHPKCGPFAEQFGAAVRSPALRRKDRSLRRHLDECERCRGAYAHLVDINAALRAVLPVAFVGWAAAGYAAAAAAGAGAGAAGGGAAVGVGAGAAAGGAGGSGAGAGAGGAAGEGASAPVKVGIGAAVVAGAVVAVALVLAGDPAEPKGDPPERTPPAVAAPREPVAKPEPEPEPDPEVPAAAEPAAPSPRPSVRPSPSRRPSVRPSPSRTPTPRPTPSRAAPPRRTPSAAPRPTPPRAPAPPAAQEPYLLDELPLSPVSDGTGPEVRMGASSPLWQRSGVRIGGESFAHGATVHPPSSVTVDLNRVCRAFDARAGVDDLAMGVGGVRFFVYGDGVLLYSSRLVKGDEQAVSVHAELTGRKVMRLVVRTAGGAPGGSAATLATWARPQISCRG